MNGVSCLVFFVGRKVGCSRDAGWEKLKTLSTACEGPPAAERSVIDTNSSNGKRNEAARCAPNAEICWDGRDCLRGQLREFH